MNKEPVLRDVAFPYRPRKVTVAKSPMANGDRGDFYDQPSWGGTGLEEMMSFSSGKHTQISQISSIFHVESQVLLCLEFKISFKKKHLAGSWHLIPLGCWMRRVPVLCKSHQFATKRFRFVPEFLTWTSWYIVGLFQQIHETLIQPLKFCVICRVMFPVSVISLHYRWMILRRCQLKMIQRGYLVGESE